jgi:RNA polymerase-binding protein DksA
MEMIMLSKAQTRQFQEQLIAQMTRLGRQQSELKREAAQGSGGETSGGLSNVPLHLGDLGSHEAEENVTLGLLENEESLMKEINDALTRIDQGSFGMCERCGAEIGKERLDAIAYARHCVACAQQVQRR